MPGRGNRRFLKAAAQLRREAPPICAGCGLMIDRDLPATHEMSWTADHEPDIATLIANGLDPSDIRWLRPMHRKCNSAKGNRRPNPPINTSRRW